MQDTAIRAVSFSKDIHRARRAGQRSRTCSARLPGSWPSCAGPNTIHPAKSRQASTSVRFLQNALLILFTTYIATSLRHPQHAKVLVEPRHVMGHMGRWGCDCASCRIGRPASLQNPATLPAYLPAQMNVKHYLGGIFLLETWSATAVVLQCGCKLSQMPMAWSLNICSACPRSG